MTKMFTFQFLIFSGAAVFLVMIMQPMGVNAQTVNPWQQAAGMSVNQDSQKRTGGLGFVVNAQSWPHLFAHGGVNGSGNTIDGPIYIDLGVIKIPNITSTGPTEVYDWGRDQLSYNAGQLKVTVSRLTPILCV